VLGCAGFGWQGFELLGGDARIVLVRRGVGV
jgi:hypothetical protein